MALIAGALSEFVGFVFSSVSDFNRDVKICVLQVRSLEMG